MTKTTQYKNTLIGPIPTEWEVKKLGEEFNVTMGQSPNSQFYNTEGIGLPLIQGNADIVDGKSIIRFYTSQITKTCEKDELIFTVRAPVGEMGIASYVSCLGRGVCSIKHSNSDSLNYIKFYLESYKDNWSKLSQGSTFEAISGNELKQFSFPLPPLPEQQKIAEVLSTWDKAIQDTDAIIKKLEDRNKALAFSLLTGKKRVKNKENSKFHKTNLGSKYPIDWEIKTVKTIFKERKEKSNDQSKYPLFSLTIEKGLTEKTDRYERSFLLKDQESNEYKLIYPNDILFNPMNLRFGAIAKSNIDEIVSVSAYYNSIYKTDENVNLDYYTNLFKTDLFINLYDRIAIGSLLEKKRVHLSNFLELEIPFPSLEEQNAIAEILNTANQEVKQYQQKLEALKLQKKGLMQQLLTGRVRTV